MGLHSLSLDDLLSSIVLYRLPDDVDAIAADEVDSLSNVVSM